MNEHVWISSSESAPPGSITFDSIETFLASSLRPEGLIIDDPAASLREADFLNVYSHSPLSRIIRRVGPWRAGLGRTDPTWPRATTCSLELSFLGVGDATTVNAPPLTADYDELAALESVKPGSLPGLQVCVSISDRELKQTWHDLWSEAGAELVSQPIEANVWMISSEATSVEEIDNTRLKCPALTVHLMSAPWQFLPSEGVLAYSITESPSRLMRIIRQQLHVGMDHA